MATIHFTGTSYSGQDEATPVRFDQPGHYRVSDAKARQLAADFPHEFTQVLEGKSEKAPSEDDKTVQAPEPTQEDTARAKPTKKGK